MRSHQNLGMVIPWLIVLWEVLWETDEWYSFIIARHWRNMDHYVIGSSATDEYIILQAFVLGRRVFHD